MLRRTAIRLIRLGILFWVLLGVLVAVGVVMPSSPYVRIGNRQIGFELYGGSLGIGVVSDSIGSQLPIFDDGGFRALSGDRITSWVETTRWNAMHCGWVVADVRGVQHAPITVRLLWLNLLLPFEILSLLPAALLARRMYHMAKRKLLARTEHKRIIAGLCHHCAYTLRGFQSRCPECGTPRRELGPPEPEYSI